MQNEHEMMGPPTNINSSVDNSSPGLEIFGVATIDSHVFCLSLLCLVGCTWAQAGICKAPDVRIF